jgi:hypothetical protein
MQAHSNWGLEHTADLQRTLLCLCSDFWLLKTWLWSPHPPYPPDLAPCNFFLFPRMKLKLKGCCSQDATEIKEQLLTVLNAIPKSWFQWCFQQWQKCWNHCINLEGDYCEGDSNE